MFDELESIEKEKDALTEKRRSVERLRKEVMELENEKVRYLDKIRIAEDFLKKAQHRIDEERMIKPNLDRAKKELDEAEKSSKEKIPARLEEMDRVLAKYTECYKNIGLNSDKIQRIAKILTILRTSLENINMESADLRNRLEDLEVEQSVEKHRLDRIKDELKELVHCTSSRRNDLHGKEREAYDKMIADFKEYDVPDDLKDIEEELSTAEAMYNAREKEGTKDDVQRLKELKVKEEQERKRKEEFEHKISNWEEDMNTMVDSWIQPLEELVEKISKNFSEYFKKIGCAGEVRLHKPDDKLDIKEYGIDIYVQFIGYSKMARLTAQQQSGGERSVTTMLYLMALQELCPVPFRCVDEINQGMDANNERKVFNMMVDLLADEKASLAHSQYFM